MEQRGDLVINGFGASNGGQFHLVKINGRGTVNSDVECSEFECNGSGTVIGNMKADKAKVNGNARFKGTIESQQLTIDGTTKIEQNVYVENIKVSGNAVVGGKVKSEEIRIKGLLKVGGDCEVEIFKADSQFTIGGLLNAEQVDIKIYGECKVKEIGGQTIIVKQKGSLIGQLLKPLFQTQLETEIIEGDKIDLENTTAKVVRGNRITIGPNCKIDLVEYTGEAFIDKKAFVVDSRKI